MNGPTEEVLKCYERFCPAILCLLMHEVARAEKLHGPLPLDMIRDTAIAGEEMGEVCEAALDHTRHNKPEHETRQHLIEEWVQLAAVSIRAVEILMNQERDR